MRDADVNELTAVNDLTHVNSANENRRAQIGKLYSTWDRMESGAQDFECCERLWFKGVAYCSLNLYRANNRISRKTFFGVQVQQPLLKKLQENWLLVLLAT